MLDKMRFTAVAYLAVVFGICIRWSASDSVEEDDGDQYFGVPLGALHFSSDGTSAEIYAADEFTIIFNHFYHNPRRPGCTAMMIGPARKEDKENVVEGHGLLMAPAHPPVAARYRTRRDTTAIVAGVRPRRQLAEQFRGWPVEFDHLLMASNVDAQPNKDPGTNDVSKDTKVNTQKVTLFNEVQRDNNTKRQLKATVIAIPRFPPTVENISKTVRADTNDKTLTSVPVITTATTTTTESSDASTVRYSVATSTTTVAETTTNVFSSSSALPYTSIPIIIETITVNSTIAEPTITSDEATGVVKKPETQEPLPIILFESKGNGKAKQVKLKSTLDLGVQVTSSGEAIPFVRNDDVSSFNDDFVRRAPSRSELTDHSKSNILNVQPLQPQSNVRSTTPLYYVIKDPREARRRRLLDLKRRIGVPLATSTTTVIPTSDELSRDFDVRFELPSIRDKLATFSLANGAKINQYKWIGLYDQCLKRHIPLVSLRDVDPPREEKISPLSGWSHNITSYRVHILNCNTVLIPGFTYNPANATANTYFYAGIGDFPNNIERQLRATVIGSRQNEPLRAYNGEDLLLRLPNGYRTFDVDFLTIYNTDEKKSYAHVILPSLLVPPCVED